MGKFFTPENVAKHTSSSHPVFDGLLASFILVLGIIFVVFVISKTCHLPSEVLRKIIHIGVSNWWFILVRNFDSIYFALIGPLLFIFVNGFATLFNLLKYIGIKESKNSFGLVYFPISLVITIFLLDFGIIEEMISGMGILIMGYSDGLAAIIGKRFPSRKMPFSRSKTINGSATMFVISFIILILFELYYSKVKIIPSIIIALIVSFVESITPYGFDNISVPLSTIFFSQLYFG